MVLFDRYIRELLFQYDCVVIPDFGGFVCSFSPAKIHPVQHRFHPPGKKISFNQMLVMNDGLLAHQIALGEKISYAASIEHISAQVIKWKEDLSNGLQVNLNGIGKFFNDSSGNLQFQYDTNLNFLVDSYGLSTFQTLPIDRNKNLKVAYSSSKPEKAEEEHSVKSMPALNRMAKYSVAAAMLSVVMLSAYKLQLFDEYNFNRISLNPFKSDKAVYESIKYEEITFNEEKKSAFRSEVEKTDKDVVYYDANIEGLENTLKVRLKDPIKKEKVENKVEIFGKYHVVGGCFGVQNNAKKMAKKLKRLGYKSDMAVMHNGLHVVSYQSFENESQARAFLQKVKAEHNNQAWLLVK